MRRPTIESPRAFALVAAATLLAALPAAAAAQQLASNVPDSLEVATLAPTPIRSDADRAARETHPSWRGHADGRFKGTVTLTLERIGVPESAIDPAWPVLVRWEYEGRDPSKSFTAELFGSGTANGKMLLHGVITSGYRAGQEVEVNVGGGAGAKATMAFVDPSAAQ
ncbi:MAG TPA: hypothetical protein VFW04_18210 [Gemmatimonadaceae bacterium]|nr:hypothetical protein [Gemmatimonadaceae bacterium]